MELQFVILAVQVEADQTLQLVLNLLTGLAVIKVESAMHQRV